MKVTLAGATVDRRFWVKDPAATPETISAAYARISHSPRTLGALRDAAVAEVEKARISNENIIYRMGHSSVAEHAVFNLDIEDASRLLVEFIESHRLASFTERSQRYVFFGDKEFLIPEELAGTRLEDEVRSLEREKFDLYIMMVDDEGYREKYGDKLLEQARYILGLTCPTDLGLTVNARELEYMISRAAAHPLAEVRQLSRALLDQCGSLAPSLIKYTEGTDHVEKTREMLRESMGAISVERETGSISCVSTADDDRVCSERPTSHDDPESEIAAVLLFENSGMPFSTCREISRKMTDDELMDLFLPVFRNYPVHSSLPRAFEVMDLTFDFDISASAFAQLKRHRMASLFVQDYNPGRWITPPLYLENPERARDYVDLMRRSAALYHRIRKDHGVRVAEYVLTNAHKRRVVFRINLRELYHFVRLRSDEHAQDEIRRISDGMVEILKEQFPLVTAMLCGKDTYAGTRKRILGCDSDDRGGEER